MEKLEKLIKESFAARREIKVDEKNDSNYRFINKKVYKELLLYSGDTLENVILNLQLSLRSNERLFDDNDEPIKKAYLIEFSDMYNAWMTELHRVYDLYGIDYAIKFKEIIYYAAIINDIINTFGDIENSNEQLGDYFIGCYESILENNIDDIDQYISNLISKVGDKFMEMDVDAWIAEIRGNNE